MKIFWKTVLSGAMVVICLALLPAACSGSTFGPASAAPISSEIRQLANEYRSLKQTKGYWYGAPPNEAVDEPAGPLYLAMNTLGDYLGTPVHHHTRAQIIELLGPPNAELTDKNPPRMVYLWRSWHDYLYFTYNGDRILGWGWDSAGG
jgi:hypothetical protein